MPTGIEETERIFFQGWFEKLAIKKFKNFNETLWQTKQLENQQNREVFETPVLHITIPK